MSMTNVTIVGNLAKAPEQICFASGRTKTVLVVAVNSQPQKDGEKIPPDYYRVEIWGKLAELAQKYLNRGNQVGVSGKLVMEHWKDRDGNDKVTPVVSATQLSFPPRYGSGSRSEGSPRSSASDDDLFAGARAITVAEPPADYFPYGSFVDTAVAVGR